MLGQLQILATLSKVEEEIEELREELGDLPIEVANAEKNVREKQKKLDIAQEDLDGIVKARAEARVTLQELKDRAKRLSEQQFQVRNNREYDALTKEIEAIEMEQKALEKEIIPSGVIEENLRNQIAPLENEVKESKESLAMKEEELAELSSDQNDEFSLLLKQRAALISLLRIDYATHYERIHAYHKEAAVTIRKGSCVGCFSFVPSQKILEMRKYTELHFCEHCGRILFPEDMEIPKEILESVTV